MVLDTKFNYLERKSLVSSGIDIRGGKANKSGVIKNFGLEGRSSLEEGAC